MCLFQVCTDTSQGYQFFCRSYFSSDGSGVALADVLFYVVVEVLVLAVDGRDRRRGALYQRGAWLMLDELHGQNSTRFGVQAKALQYVRTHVPYPWDRQMKLLTPISIADAQSFLGERRYPAVRGPIMHYITWKALAGSIQTKKMSLAPSAVGPTVKLCEGMSIESLVGMGQ